MARGIGLHLLFALFCVFSVPCSAQDVVPAAKQSLQPNGVALVSVTQPIASLDGPWKFSIGDSPIDPKTKVPLWAEPGFNDLSWETVDLTPVPGLTEPGDGWAGYIPGWTGRGHAKQWGYAWYRIHVRINGGLVDEKKAIGVWDVDDAFELFANGILLGSSGKFSVPGQRVLTYYSKPLMFVLPPSDSDSYTLAFRVWLQPLSVIEDPNSGGLHIAPVVGETNAVASAYQHAWIVIVRGFGSAVLEALVYLALAIFCASLILFDRVDRVYFWLAGAFLVFAVASLNACVESWTQFESEAAFELVNGTLNALILALWLTVWWHWWELRRPRWLPNVTAALTLLYVISKMPIDEVFRSHPLVIDHDMHIILMVTRLAFLALFAIVGFHGIRQRGREGWIALPALVLIGLSEFDIELLYLHIPIRVYLFGIGINIDEVSEWLLSALIFVLLLRRLRLSLRRQRQLALDVKQAQEVQQVILPEARTVLPGLVIESEYRPAREVGGDFFQIIPNEADKSLLIVAGDVTGKGLKAGMLVALLVGAMRSSADECDDPKYVLKALNRRLVGRADAQATCLAIRISKDGCADLANAGHIAPYLNGVPLPMEGALPLGMIEVIEPSALQFQLHPDDRLVMISDGIAEATNDQGELFGFERLQNLISSSSNATEVAVAAQAFGQEDDISVIAVTRIGVAEPAVV